MRAWICLLATGTAVQANVYDYQIENYAPDSSTCRSGCAEWVDVKNSTVQNAWANFSSAKGNLCAMPAALAGYRDGDGGRTYDNVLNSFQGPWCYCESPAPGAGNLQYCRPSKHAAPEQLNLQVAADNVVVASFVTHEATTEGVACMGEIWAVDGSGNLTNGTVVRGVSHFYSKLTEVEKAAKGVLGNYFLHFVRFGELKESTTYAYRVKTSTGAYGEVHQFRSLQHAGTSSREPTRIGVYGDMGHGTYNNMGNLRDACEAKEISAILHAGDHAYDLGEANDTRGDAYMNVYSPVLSACPWIPIVGNHEEGKGNDGDHGSRYLNMTFGETLGGVTSTATNSLGELLTKATLLGASWHSKIPSNTSLYFSVVVGRIQIVALENSYPDATQMKWLNATLAAVDRKATPWVIVSSHYPLYHPATASNSDASAAYYMGEEAEHSPSAFRKAAEGEETVGELLALSRQSIEPLLMEHKVDMYFAGHQHNYAATYPICNGTRCGTDFIHPKGPVHVCEGNGGVPGTRPARSPPASNACGPQFKAKNIPWCRVYEDGVAYGRITAWNATHLTYEHIHNENNNVTDSFTIVKQA